MKNTFTRGVPLVAVMVTAALAPRAGADEAAVLRYPLSVAAAPDGSLVVADRMAPGLWRFRDGAGSTAFAGSKRFRTPLSAVRTVAVAADGGVYAGDSATREVYRIAADGTATPLTGGQIGIPIDIAIDAKGVLHVSDLETQRIVRIPAEGGKPEVVAEVAAPRGLCFDSAGRLWAVAASGEEPLVRIAADGTVEPVVRGRTFEFPHDVVVDADGIAYVTDNYARAIWRVKPDGSTEKWLSGPPLVGPVGLALRDGRLLVADPRARAIFEVDREGMVRPVAGTPQTAEQDAQGSAAAPAEKGPAAAAEK